MYYPPTNDQSIPNIDPISWSRKTRARKDLNEFQNVQAIKSSMRGFEARKILHNGIEVIGLAGPIPVHYYENYVDLLGRKAQLHCIEWNEEVFLSQAQELIQLGYNSRIIHAHTDIKQYVKAALPLIKSKAVLLDFDFCRTFDTDWEEKATEYFTEIVQLIPDSIEYIFIRLTHAWRGESRGKRGLFIDIYKSLTIPFLAEPSPWIPTLWIENSYRDTMAMATVLAGFKKYHL